MNCQTFQNEYARCGKPEDLSSVAAEHLKTCPACRRVAASYTRFLRLADEEKQMEVPPFLTTRIMARLPDNPPAVEPARPAVLLLRVAAVVVAGLIGFSGAVIENKQRERKETAIALSDYLGAGMEGLAIENDWINAAWYEN